MKRAMVLMLALVFVFSMTACEKSKTERYEAEFLTLFDTVTKIVAYTEDKAAFTEYADQFHDELETYHQLYDIYNDYKDINNIKTINDNAGIKPVKVDKKIIDLVKFAKDEYKRIDGEMNIAMGSVLEIWHEYREDGIDNEDRAEVPPKKKLKRAAKHMDLDKVVVDETAGTVFLQEKKMRLDVGAVGKGYAVEQVCRFIKEKGLTSALVSVGGNVKAIGMKENDQSWNVGVENPEEKTTNLVVMNLKDEQSLVTSGNYERYYEVEGKRYHHLIDKDTLFPATYFAAVTILCNDSGQADALSTAVYNMPYAKGKKLVESLSGAEAMWVYNDGSIKYSSGFERQLKK